jgi:uncharacterized protein (DUF2141 family)
MSIRIPCVPPAWAAVLLLGLGCTVVHGDDPVVINVNVHNVQPGKGQLLVGLCKQTEFLTGNCTATSVQAVTANPHAVRLAGVPAGVYAVQVVYDKNKNFKMDTGAFGVPAEPVGFSRNAVGRMGPPHFKDASFEYDGKGQSMDVRVY